MLAMIPSTLCVCRTRRYEESRALSTKQALFSREVERIPDSNRREKLTSRDSSFYESQARSHHRLYPHFRLARGEKEISR